MTEQPQPTDPAGSRRADEADDGVYERLAGPWRCWGWVCRSGRR